MPIAGSRSSVAPLAVVNMFVPVVFAPFTVNVSGSESGSVAVRVPVTVPDRVPAVTVARG